uniref:Melanin-concentrating hormone receptor 1 n=1 Tax=Pipistrellus kuhlii TaxID=59472 RepID=A0A7J7ZK44_PIPKU|nr:melanin concentrating hormone receptor 1 [Pipistrellus kuhlii]
MSVRAGRQGVGREWGSEAAEAARLPGSPLREALRLARQDRAPGAGHGGCRSRGGGRASGRGHRRMDLEALVLTSGPNASNLSAGRDNLTSAGPPPRRGSMSYVNIIMPSVFGTICLLGIVGNSMVIFAVAKKSKLHWCSNVPDIFIINLSFFLAFALPFAVITAAYVRILQRMTSSVAPASQRSIRLRTRKVTRTAIAICLVFFVCWAPYYVLQLTQLSISRPTLAFVYLYNAAISLGYANSCLNPFVYIVLCETFRKRLVLSVKPAGPGQLRAVSHEDERTESKGA